MSLNFKLDVQAVTGENVKYWTSYEYDLISYNFINA